MRDTNLVFLIVIGPLYIGPLLVYGPCFYLYFASILIGHIMCVPHVTICPSKAPIFIHPIFAIVHLPSCGFIQALHSLKIISTLSTKILR